MRPYLQAVQMSEDELASRGTASRISNRIWGLYGS